MITLNTLRETVRKAKAGISFAPFALEIDATVADGIRNRPNDSDETIHENVDLQMEFLSISPQYIAELAGFFRENPQALETYLAEIEADLLEPSATAADDVDYQDAEAFLNQLCR